MGLQKNKKMLKKGKVLLQYLTQFLLSYDIHYKYEMICEIIKGKKKGVETNRNHQDLSLKQ